MNLAIVDFAQIPGMEVMRQASVGLIGLAGTAAALRDINRARLGGQTNLSDGLIRCIGGALLVWGIPQIAGWLVAIIQVLSDSIAEESRLQLFGEAVGMALGSTTCESSWYETSIALLFTLKGWLALTSSILYMLMFLLKFVIIDIIWSAVFSLILVGGVFSVPIGLFPGMDTIKGWFRNVIEVAFWPVMFQLIVAFLSMLYPKLLHSMAGGEIALDCGMPAAQAIGTEAADVASTVAPEQSGGFVSILQFLGLCAAYCLLLVFTPFVSAIIIRSAPAGVLGGIMAAKAMSMMTSGVQKLVGAAAGGFGGGGGFAGGGGASVITGGGTAGVAALPMKAAPQILDERRPGGLLGGGPSMGLLGPGPSNG